MDEPVGEDVQEQAERWLLLASQLEQWAGAALRAARAAHDPSLRQLVVLFAVREGVVSPVELARYLVVSRAVMTGLLDRLEQNGLVRREPDPTDRRRLRVVATEAGIEATDRLGRAVIGQLAAEIGRGAPEELAASERALGLLERTVVGLRATGPPRLVVAGSIAPWDDEAVSASESDAD